MFSIWFAASERFRKFAFSLNPRVLTSVQVWRIVGFTFVLLQARNVLPGIFAFPAGYGDMFIGVTAGFAAWKLAEPAHRGSFIFWQALGILDLITAVSLGTTAGLLDPHGASMVAMTVLPLSLIPTFLVPLFLMLHVICIAQARKWNPSAQVSRQAVKAVAACCKLSLRRQNQGRITQGARRVSRMGARLRAAVVLMVVCGWGSKRDPQS